MGHVTPLVQPIAEALPAMQAFASRTCEEEAPWFTHHFLDLAGLGVRHVDGYGLRHVEPGEAASRAACHAGAVSTAALAAARDAGATTGKVCPRGDDGYPLPMRVYQRIGFEPGPRTITLVRPALNS